MTLPVKVRNGPIRTYHSRRFYAVAVGPLYFVVKDTRRWPTYYAERNRIGCQYVTVAHWRWVIRWRVPT